MNRAPVPASVVVRRSLKAFAIVFMVCHGGATFSAAGLYPVDRRAGSIEAELDVERDDYELAGDVGILETRASRVGISLFEAVRPELTLGFFGGVVSVSQSGQALTAGMSPGGEYLGLSLRSVPLGGSRWRLGIAARLLYQSVDDATADQRVELDWLETEASAVFAFDVTGTLSLYAGSSYTGLDVDQRARGVVNSTVEFTEHETGSAIAGLDLEVDPGGFVTLFVRGGARDGFTLRFRRIF